MSIVGDQDPILRPNHLEQAADMTLYPQITNTGWYLESPTLILLAGSLYYRS